MTNEVFQFVFFLTNLLAFNLLNKQTFQIFIRQHITDLPLIIQGVMEVHVINFITNRTF
jgi:hypothetical protein